MDVFGMKGKQSEVPTISENGPFRKVSPMTSGRSQSYSHGLSSMGSSMPAQPTLSRAVSSDSSATDEVFCKFLGNVEIFEIF